MKFVQTMGFVAAIAMMADARKPSPWAVQRTNDVKNRLERTYGKGLVGMMKPGTNEIDPSRFGWDNKKTGGAPLGSNLSVTITSGLTIDGTTSTAFWLGFSKGMQYEGLKKAESETANLPGNDTPLTNCFASTYSLMTSLDNAGHNLKTINSEPGTFKGFDVLFIDPTHVLADFTVNWEMCEFDGIIEQFKLIAGLDYASIADNLSRQALVIAMEMPDGLDRIREFADAAKCA
jgi:hypothetical protein